MDGTSAGRIARLVGLSGLVSLFGILGAATVRAQESDSAVVVRRAEQVVAMLSGADVKVDTLFAASFLAQVPAAQMKAIGGQFAALGHMQRPVLKTRPVPGGPPASAIFDVATDKGYTFPLTIVVDAAAPRLVSGLLLGNGTRTGSIDDVLKEYRDLPGHASLLVAKLDGSKLAPSIAIDTGRALGIGSAFKLFVLAELVREIEAGKRHWSDVVLLDSMSRSLPSGVLQTWPVGTPVTLETLAIEMISISDNTAADHLAHMLGRTNVEAMQRTVGSTSAEMNMPFLTTREMFVLKIAANQAFKQRYIEGTPDQRRVVLSDPAILKRQAGSPDFANGPNAIDKLEWFATTNDLARALVWIRDHSATGEAARARDVLTVNKGLTWPRAAWPYVGFKGGSEPGVLNLSFIAQRADGTWMVFIATWNDPAKEVDEAKFVALMTRIRDLAK